MEAISLRNLSSEEQVAINGGLLIYLACFAAGLAVGYLAMRCIQFFNKNLKHLVIKKSNFKNKLIMSNNELSTLSYNEMVMTEGGVMIALCVIMFALGVATAMCCVQFIIKKVG